MKRTVAARPLPVSVGRRAGLAGNPSPATSRSGAMKIVGACAPGQALGPVTEQVFVQMLSAERRAAARADRDRHAHVSGAVTHVAIHRVSPSGSMNIQMSRHASAHRDPGARKSRISSHFAARQMATSTSKRHGPLISTSEIEAIIRARSCPDWSNASLIACSPSRLSAAVGTARVMLW
jgi:hypothetical protein